MRTMAATRMGSAWESGESGAPTRYMRDEPDGRLEPPMCGHGCALADGAGVGVAAAATASPCDAGCVESWTVLEPPLEVACEVFVTANTPAPAAAASPAAATAVATHRAR